MGERASLLPEMHAWESVAPARRTDEGVSVRVRPLRHDVWTVLRYRASIPHRSRLQRASYACEVGVLVLILLNVLLAMRESAVLSQAPTESYVGSDWYDSFLYVSTIIFSVEYALRLWSCVEDERFAHPINGRFAWMLRPMSLIDLIVLLPFYLEIISEHHMFGASRGVLTLRGLRLLRIMSFLRLERSYNAMKNLRTVFALKAEELWVVSYLTAVVVITASTTIFFLENPAQPEVFSSIGVCAWWAIETITSLGYGDIVPMTAGGRFFSSVLALWGIILFTIPGAVLGSGFVEVMLQKQEATKERMQEEIQRSFSRELFAVNSTAFKRGAADEPLSSPVAQVSLIHFQQLQEQVQALRSMQDQVQAQLHAQKAQLDAVLRLLEDSASVRPSRVTELPPFSEITVPTATGT